MKPTELRIGNYVKLRDTGEIVRVCGLTKRKIGFHAPNERPNAQLRYRRYSEIEGVLIYDHWQKIDCSELLFIGEDYIDTEYWYCYTKYPDRKLRYIHELQNLHYALTDKELKIEL